MSADFRTSSHDKVFLKCSQQNNPLVGLTGLEQSLAEIVPVLVTHKFSETFFYFVDNRVVHVVRASVHSVLKSY